MNNDELKHYGVLGMKWGIRKANKQGTTYKYKSLGQKHYENKVEKLSKKPKTDPYKLSKAKEKKRIYEQRDSNRESYVRQLSTGKAFVRTFLVGPINSGNYNRYRASGKSVVESSLRSGAGMITIVGTGGLSAPLFLVTSRREELIRAKAQLSHGTLYHWGFKKDHKYIAKVKKPNGKYRYFYDKAEYEAFISGEKDSEKESSNPFDSFMDFAKKGAYWVAEFATGGFLAPVTETLLKVDRNKTSGARVKSILDLITKKPVSELKKKHKYIAKVPRGDGTYRYFYDEDEHIAYIKKLEYQENEPDFLKNIAEETDENADDMRETNPNYSKYSKAYSTNCWFCSNAYELRKRGYDVEADAMTGDKAMMTAITSNSEKPNVFVKSIEHGMKQWYENPESKSVRSNDISKLDKVIQGNSPKNSRGQLSVLWKGGGGHSLIYEVDNSGNVSVVDSQVNMRYVNDDVYRNLDAEGKKRTKRMSSLTQNIKTVVYTRTDNLELKEGILDVVVENYK